MHYMHSIFNCSLLKNYKYFRKAEKYNVVHKEDKSEKEKKPEEISLYHREEHA